MKQAILPTKGEQYILTTRISSRTPPADLYKNPLLSRQSALLFAPERQPWHFDTPRPPNKLFFLPMEWSRTVASLCLAYTMSSGGRNSPGVWGHHSLRKTRQSLEGQGFFLGEKWLRFWWKRILLELYPYERFLFAVSVFSQPPKEERQQNLPLDKITQEAERNGNSQRIYQTRTLQSHSILTVSILVAIVWGLELFLKHWFSLWAFETKDNTAQKPM